MAAMVEPGKPGERGSYRPTLQWYDFLNRLAASLDTSSGQQGEIADIQAEIERIQEALTAGIVGPASVRVLGSLSSGSVTLQLVNDEVAPSDGFYYGTDSTGTKGWHARLLASLLDIDFTTPPADADVLTYVAADDAWKALPSQATDSTVPYFVPDGETYIVNLYRQALWSAPIELGAGASLEVNGALIEVN
ncbi:hypothetical protein M8R20_26345 [Pseudomonas sp. R2.Fl]|nr:hypothetical protein [Pseudomonas sp. R2.Fl]MCL6710464.1 hypothetical protein [Pseudomonas sp. R2.Fl]MCL6710524.1 hypothetical protein [Pseudomonas sp. R2.Fl]